MLDTNNIKNRMDTRRQQILAKLARIASDTRLYEALREEFEDIENDRLNEWLDSLEYHGQLGRSLNRMNLHK